MYVESCNLFMLTQALRTICHIFRQEKRGSCGKNKRVMSPFVRGSNPRDPTTRGRGQLLRFSGFCFTEVRFEEKNSVCFLVGFKKRGGF
jgi:hypothetical protein